MGRWCSQSSSRASRARARRRAGTYGRCTSGACAFLRSCVSVADGALATGTSRCALLCSARGTHTLTTHGQTRNSYFTCTDPTTIDRIFARLRDWDGEGTRSYPRTLAGLPVTGVRDLTLGYDSANAPSYAPTLPLSSGHMLTVRAAAPAGGAALVLTTRTSGTEPKVRFLFCVSVAEGAKGGVDQVLFGGQRAGRGGGRCAACARREGACGRVDGGGQERARGAVSGRLGPPLGKQCYTKDRVCTRVGRLHQYSQRGEEELRSGKPRTTSFVERLGALPEVDGELGRVRLERI